MTHDTNLDKAKQLSYGLERKEYTDRFFTVTNTKGEQPITPRELEELPEGKTPSFQGS